MQSMIQPTTRCVKCTLSLNWVLRMVSFGTNTRSQTLAPFIDGFIHDRLLQSMPHVNRTLLQFGDVTNSRLVHLLQHRTGCKPISLEIYLVERWFCGAAFWLSTISSTCATLTSVHAVLGHPLPARRLMLPVSCSFWNSVSKPDVVKFFSGNSANNLREP